MKWLLAVVVFCWGVAACDNSQVPTSPDPSMAVAAAGQAKTLICHYEADTDTYTPVTVANISLAPHYEHGDVLPGALADHSAVWGTDCVLRHVVFTGDPYNVGPYGDLVGGTAADATHQCPAGSVAVGMEGFWGNFVHSYQPTVAHVRYRCAPLRGDGTLGTTTWTAYMGAAAGFYDSNTFDATCTGALVGVFGHWGTYLEEVGGRCATIARVLADGSYQSSIGPWGVNWYTSFGGVCDAGSVGIGMIGRGGAGVNAVGLTCRAIEWQPVS